jgi:hypothetical protein
MATKIVDTYNKALSINLDPTIFGTFAEIGAGQETSRWFLRVGAASGTVAKTISAYEKVVSDDLYGAGNRYVSKQRLEAMLEAEWLHLQKQLAGRSSTLRTFVFANTVSARNYAGTNQCHGWVGLRFLSDPAAEMRNIVLHVNLLDHTTLLQQEALGILGVNLIYAAYFHLDERDRFLSDLLQELELDRIQVDFIETRGDFPDEWSPKHLWVALVSGGLSEAVLLPHSGNYQPMNEAFYKSPVVVEPGTFEDRERIHTEMLTAALKRTRSDQSIEAREAIGVFCLSAMEKAVGDGPGSLLSASELSARADALLAEGFDVLLTVHRELYKISALISTFTSEPVRFVIGVSVLVKLFAAVSYLELDGRIFEGLSRLFTENVRIYVYPMTLQVLRTKLPPELLTSWNFGDLDGLLTADQITPRTPLAHLYAYLLAIGAIESV